MSLDSINDRLQQSPDAQRAWDVLASVSDGMLRKLCDLNHLETGGKRDALTYRLIADVHGNTAAGAERIARSLGASLLGGL